VNTNVKKHFWQYHWDGRPIKVIKDAAVFSASQFNPRCPFSPQEHWETAFACEEERRNETLVKD